MQVYVCVKHVPDTAANIVVVGENEFNESVKSVVNPYDEYAIEEAVQTVKQTGGEVVIITIGKEEAIATVRSALALGADRAIFVKTEAQFLDSSLTSKILKKAIEQDGSPDLIFMGKQSVDSEGMQTHYRLAAAFDMPVATEIIEFKLGEGKAVVVREIDGGIKEVSEITTPCVIGTTKGLNEPRYPKLPDILKAKKKEVKNIDIAEFGEDLNSGKNELVSLELIPDRGAAKIIEGSAQEMAKQLVTILKQDERIL
jgi:electron transfer flavoprotein beta subunit